MSPREIVRFWREAGYDAWFKKSAAFDDACRAFEMAGVLDQKLA